MSGFNPTDCLKERCPNWKTTNCNRALEIIGAINLDPSKNRRRIYCGMVIGPLLSEASDIEAIGFILDKDIPMVLDETV